MTAATEIAASLAQKTVAVRLRKSAFTCRRRLSSAETTRAADVFSAEASMLRATKKLLDTRNIHYRAVSSTLHAATAAFRASTRPYPENGVRLVDRDRLDSLFALLGEYSTELGTAVNALQDAYAQLREDARQRLADLFNDGDYPTDIRPAFAISWEIVPTDPPEFLKQVAPALYEAELARVQARMEEAVRLTEEAFAVELQKLTAHLVERLQPGEDGKPKVFRDSALTGFSDFLQRFRALSTGSMPALVELVGKAESILQGADVGAIRKDVTARSAIAESMGEVLKAANELPVDAIIRKIHLDELEEEFSAAG